MQSEQTDPLQDPQKLREQASAPSIRVRTPLSITEHGLDGASSPEMERA